LEVPFRGFRGKLIATKPPNPPEGGVNNENCWHFLEYSVKNLKYRNTPTFLGVGSHKIFRDMVYANRGFFPADYDFYQNELIMDFPNKNLFNRFKSKIFYLMQQRPEMRKKLKEGMNENIIKPFRRMLDEME